jgi:hypothetical protein
VLPPALTIVGLNVLGNVIFEPTARERNVLGIAAFVSVYLATYAYYHFRHRNFLRAVQSSAGAAFAGLFITLFVSNHYFHIQQQVDSVSLELVRERAAGFATESIQNKLAAGEFLPPPSSVEQETPMAVEGESGPDRTVDRFPVKGDVRKVVANISSMGGKVYVEPLGKGGLTHTVLVGQVGGVDKKQFELKTLAGEVVTVFRGNTLEPFEGANLVVGVDEMGRSENIAPAAARMLTKAESSGMGPGVSE